MLICSEQQGGCDPTGLCFDDGCLKEHLGAPKDGSELDMGTWLHFRSLERMFRSIAQTPHKPLLAWAIVAIILHVSWKDNFWWFPQAVAEIQLSSSSTFFIKTQGIHTLRGFLLVHFLVKEPCVLSATPLSITVSKAIPFGNIPRELLKFILDQLLINSASESEANGMIFTSEANFSLSYKEYGFRFWLPSSVCWRCLSTRFDTGIDLTTGNITPESRIANFFLRQGHSPVNAQPHIYSAIPDRLITRDLLARR